MTWIPSASRMLLLPRLDATPRGFIQAPAVIHRWQDKHPSALLDYGVDLQNRLDPTDTIVLLNAAVTPSGSGGLVIVDSLISGTIIAVRLEDGIADQDYAVAFAAGTANGSALYVTVSLLVAIT